MIVREKGLMRMSTNAKAETEVTVGVNLCSEMRPANNPTILRLEFIIQVAM